MWIRGRGSKNPNFLRMLLMDPPKQQPPGSPSVFVLRILAKILCWLVKGPPRDVRNRSFCQPPFWTKKYLSCAQKHLVVNCVVTGTTVVPSVFTSRAARWSISAVFLLLPDKEPMSMVALKLMNLTWLLWMTHHYSLWLSMTNMTHTTSLIMISLGHTFLIFKH